MFLALTWLAAITIAAEPATTDNAPAKLAVVSATGSIFASSDGGASWLAVHRCPVPAPEVQSDDEAGPDCGSPPAAIAWAQGSLYLACTGDTLMRWQPGASSAQPAGVTAMDRLVALGRQGRALLAADREGTVWTYEPGRPARTVAIAPEPPQAIAGRQGSIVVAGSTAVWQLDRPGSEWRPLAPLRACALASAHAPGDQGQDVLWLAGPDGLFELQGSSLSARLVAPVTGVALADATVLVARALTLTTLGAPADATGPPAPAQERSSGLVLAPPRWRVDWSELMGRAYWARWVPRLSAGLSYRSSDQTRGIVEVWVWLTWTPGTEVFP